MRLLAVGAHLDDAEIACGGTLAKAVHSGHQVRIVALTHSAYKNYDGEVRRTREQAVEEGLAAAVILGLKRDDVQLLDYPTGNVPYDNEIIGNLESALDQFRPDCILTHWPFDTHQDHRWGALNTLAAARWYRSVVMYEPMMPASRSYVGFRSQLYVDISDFVETKVHALEAHASQYERYGTAWIEAVRARGRLRGFEMGVEQAEAFEVVRLDWAL